MKKKIVINSLIGLVLIGGVVLGVNIFSKEEQVASDNNNFEFENIIIPEESIIPVEDLEHLEEHADLIISGVATDHKYNHVEMFSDETSNVPLYYWTETFFNINKIHKNETGQEIDESVIVYEPYAIVDKDLYISDRYEIAEPGKDYLIFLVNDSEEGKFLPVGVYQGIYSFDDSDNHSDIQSHENPEFEKLKESVLDKYKDIHVARIA